jgi:hypothetical protein
MYSDLSKLVLEKSQTNQYNKSKQNKSLLSKNIFGDTEILNSGLYAS